jgi:GR25 family glycosyltransferase involved in LPS biosynthesis
MKIEHIFYINLEHRQDRKQHVEGQLKSIGLSGERFNAIKMKDGRVGCTLSHIKCLELAIERKLDHIFICEDDITFTKPGLLKQNLDKFLNDDEIKWDVCIIGGNNLPPYEKTTPYCVKISKCQTTTGYIVKNHYFKKLLENYKDGLLKLMRNPNDHFNYAVDKYWFSLQGVDNWYLIVPLTVVQLEGYSDIENKNINYYGRLMLDLDKRDFLIQQNIERQRLMNLLLKQQEKDFIKGKMSNLIKKK